MTYATRTPAVKAICTPRWVSWPQSKRDPCDGCPLFQPCVMKGAGQQGLESFNTWIAGINKAAAALENT